MRYTVTWSAVALSQVAQLWLSASDRGSVTSATDKIDQVLCVDPAKSAIHLREGLWRITVPPLAAIFEIREADRVVKVARVRRIAPE